MFNSIASELLIEVDDDSDGSSFDELGTLQEYDVIVFSNTSGDAILDPDQRSNFEDWIAAGGNVLGIHAASDTYRHSTANGSNVGAWDFYAELIGASVQASPNHVNGTPLYNLHHIGMHASTEALPDPWEKEEEYYYWENGYFNALNQPVLEVEATIGPNGMVNSYDAPRPMSWYRITGTGRVFYTALGHALSNYTSNDLFRTHVRDALEWLLESTTSIAVNGTEELLFSHDPIEEVLWVRPSPEDPQAIITIHDATGRLLRKVHLKHDQARIDLQDLPKGVYLISGSDRKGRGFIL